MSEANAADDWLLQYQMRCEQEADEARREIALICEQLQPLGASQIHIAYDGYGDEGAVQSVAAYSAANEEIDLSHEQYVKLASAACLLLPDGWENGDDAFGELVINVASRNVTREHNRRVQSSEYEEEKFSL